MRVLLVEDEKHLREQITQQLKQQNLTIDAVADGEEGLFMGAEYPYDVAIIDLGLPKPVSYTNLTLPTNREGEGEIGP